MTDDPARSDAPSPTVKREGDRAAARAEALRANLLRRKAQARGRTAPQGEDGG
jgi:hypothetical protein